MSKNIPVVDLRNLSCPEPVLRAKKFFDTQKCNQAQFLVDDEVCVNNLQRLAHYLQASSMVNDNHGYYTVTITGSGSHEGTHEGSTEGVVQSTSLELPLPTRTVVLIKQDTFGSGDQDFGQVLINVFLQTILDSGLRPQVILLANSGVKLLAVNSQTTKVLADFQSQGVPVLACGLCLEYYKLKEAVPPEQITSMYEICQYLFASDRVISP